MRVELGGVRRSGRAVDLSGAGVSPASVVRAVRDPADDRVGCPEPGPAHGRVGLVAGAGLDRRATLAAVARSRGETTPAGREAARLREELAAMDPPAPAVAASRERVAEASDEVAERRERVATFQGRVRAVREAGGDADAEEARLAAAVRDLSEAETERVAAEESLEAARREARAARDARERRLGLQDRVANLEREARTALSRRVRPLADAAAVAVPGSPAGAFADADPVTARLAAARVADLDAPVVLACRRFPGADAAAAWLDARVLRL